MSLEKSAHVITPTIAPGCGANDDVVVCALIAGALASTGYDVTMVAVDADIEGRGELRPWLGDADVHTVAMDEPVSPAMGIGDHPLAIAVHQYISELPPTEIHTIDHRGVASVAASARQLGLDPTPHPITVHVVGGSIWRHRRNDQLMTDTAPLVSDILERTQLEDADHIVVHDHHAWDFWVRTAEITRAPDVLLSQPAPTSPASETVGDQVVASLSHVGDRSVEDGLPAFSHAIELLKHEARIPPHVASIGTGGRVGGLDGVSYFYRRAKHWAVDHVDIDPHPDIHACLVAALAAERIVLDIGRRVSVLHRLVSQTPRSIVVSNPSPADYVAALAAANLDAARMTASACISVAVGELARAFARRTPAPVPQPLQLSSSPPSVSVVIVHHERPDMLRNALSSAQAMRYPGAVEILIVDDGSRGDESVAALEEIEGEGVRVLRQTNRYLGAARNHGLREASGEFVLFMDDDNLARPEQLELLVAAAQRTNADVCIPQASAFWEESQLEQSRAPLLFAPLGADATLGAFTNCFGDANSLYRTETLRSVGGYSEDYGITHEDWELHARLALSGARRTLLPAATFWYRIDPDGMLRGEVGALRRSSDFARHLRPYLETLPYAEAKAHLFSQGLMIGQGELDTVFDGIAEATLEATRRTSSSRQGVPYGRVALICRTKDRPLLLRRAIEGILAQTFGDWLLVIVNDGGDADLLDDLVEEYRSELADRVVVVHNPISTGMQPASNIGILSCDSEYILIHDDDDSLEPDFLARTIGHLDTAGWDGSLGGVVTWSNLVVETVWEDEIYPGSSTIFKELHSLNLRDLAVENRFPPISFVFTRAAYETVGSFDDEAGPLGDWDFHLRVLRDFDIPVLPEPLANYHHRDAGDQSVYGNSVHAGRIDHRQRRDRLITRAARRGDTDLAQLLVLGDFQHALETSGRDQTNHLARKIEAVDGQVSWHINQLTGRVDGHHQPVQMPGRNRVVDGDFSMLSGMSGKVHEPTEVGRGVFVIPDGQDVTWSGLTTTGEHPELAVGSPFLRIGAEDVGATADYLTLEFELPSVLMFRGETVTFSFCARQADCPGADPLSLVARHRYSPVLSVDSAVQQFSPSTDWTRHHFAFTFPDADDAAVKTGHNSRVVMLLPLEQFELDITEVQLELGGATTFERI